MRLTTHGSSASAGFSHDPRSGCSPRRTYTSSRRDHPHPTVLLAAVLALSEKAWRASRSVTAASVTEPQLRGSVNGSVAPVWPRDWSECLDRRQIWGKGLILQSFSVVSALHSFRRQERTPDHLFKFKFKFKPSSRRGWWGRNSTTSWEGGSAERGCSVHTERPLFRPRSRGGLRYVTGF